MSGAGRAQSVPSKVYFAINGTGGLGLQQWVCASISDRSCHGSDVGVDVVDTTKSNKEHLC